MDHPLLPEESLEAIQLTRTATLWQRREGHRCATDDVLCAWAGLTARPAAGQILDLGCGQGAVTIMLAEALPRATLTGIEAQEVSYALLVRNLAANRLAARVNAIHGDLRDVRLSTRADLVTGSPPFMPQGSGTLPRDPQRAAGRFELRGGIEAYCAAAHHHLAPEGIASLLMDGSQDVRSRAALDGAGLTLVRTLAVSPVADLPPRYIIYQARRRDGAPEPREERVTLAVRDRSGSWTPRYAHIRTSLQLPETGS